MKITATNVTVKNDAAKVSTNDVVRTLNSQQIPMCSDEIKTLPYRDL